MGNKKWECYEKLSTKILKSDCLKFKFGNTEYSFSNALEQKGPVYGQGKNCKIKHQIDIQLFDKTQNIYLYGECKFHKSKIEKNEVSAFIKVIENIKELDCKKKIIPVFVCCSSFNSGAKNMLDQYNFDYLILRSNITPHFVANCIKIKRIMINNRWIEFSDKLSFYNEFHGQNESLYMTINMFLTYKVNSIPLYINNATICKNDVVIAENPYVDIIQYDKFSSNLRKKVTKIEFEYIGDVSKITYLKNSIIKVDKNFYNVDDNSNITKLISFKIK